MVAKEKYKQLYQSLDDYMLRNKLRKTDERIAILDMICSFSSFFDVKKLYDAMEESRYHVSLATLYNTIVVFMEAGVLVKHQFGGKTNYYELKTLANQHVYLICSKCGGVIETSRKTFDIDLKTFKQRRFTPDSYSLYVYGLCSKCKYSERKKPINKEIINKHRK